MVRDSRNNLMTMNVLLLSGQVSAVALATTLPPRVLSGIVRFPVINVMVIWVLLDSNY